MIDKEEQPTLPTPQRGKRGDRARGERGSQPDSANHPGGDKRDTQARQRPKDDERPERRRQLDEAEKNWDEE